MFRQLMKAACFGLAALDFSRERMEEYIGSNVAKVVGAGADDAQKLEGIKERLKNTLGETTLKIAQRSQALENQFQDKLKRQIADLSLSALNDSKEVNELRAEIAELRSEVVQLKSKKPALTK